MIARYSPIAPVSLLHQLQARRSLGNYLLLLAHDVFRHETAYHELVRYLAPIEGRSDEGKLIIMDNGTVEQGKPVAFSAVLDAARYVKAHVVVTPDIIGDMQGTIKLVANEVLPHHEDPDFEFDLMRIPQGKTHKEVLECIRWLYQNVKAPDGCPSYWGVPRWFANEFGSRIPYIQYINALDGNAQIHLLGMSKEFLDDMRCTRLPNVIGIDSANPLVLGVAGYDMNVDIGQRGERTKPPHMHRGNYWGVDTLYETCVRNVRYMHANVG